MLAIKLIKYRKGKGREREGLQVARNISDIPWEQSSNPLNTLMKSIFLQMKTLKLRMISAPQKV